MRENRGTPVWAVIGGGLLLAWPAAWNGYPLVFADSGTYLGQAIQGYLGWDRPAHYSLFLHALHWRVTLWTIPLAQGLMAAHLLAVALRALDRPGAGPLLLLAGGAALLTGLPWFAAQLQPDLFTGLAILAAWLLGFAWDRLGRRERWYVAAFATGAVAVHQAHLPLVAGLALAGGALLWVQAGRARAGAAAVRMAAPVLVAAASIVAANAIAHGRAALSPFGSVFLAARLLEDGPALGVLDRRCPDSGWQVCALRRQLPMPANHFLWPPQGPLRGPLGGGEAWAAEAGALVAATLRDEPLAVARAMAGNALRQFGMLRTGDGLEPWRDEPGPEPLIRTYFPREAQAYALARQSRGLLLGDARALAPLHAALAWAGLLALPAVAWLRRRHLPALALCVMVLAAALGNALLTGALSGPAERYQARIAWVFAVAPVLALAAAPVVLRRRGTAAARG